MSVLTEEKGLRDPSVIFLVIIMIEKCGARVEGVCHESRLTTWRGLENEGQGGL